MTECHWDCADGERIVGDRFEARAPQAQAVIAPAMGVPRGFYRRFAEYLAGRGITTIVFDYRDRPGARLADWGRLDLEAVLSGQVNECPTFLIGHSCGGQIAGLAPSCRRLTGLVLVAAQSGYWGHWQDRGRLGMWLLGHLLIPLLARGDRFPARRLGLFPVDPPAGVITEWGRWMRNPRYLFDRDNDLDTTTYRDLTQSALVYGFDDDGYAPPAAIDALLVEYPRLSVTRHQLSPADTGDTPIGHMGFFRQHVRETLWRPAADWLLAVADTENREPTNAMG